LAGIQTNFGTDSKANALFNQGVSDRTKMTMQDRTCFIWLLTEFFGAMEFLMPQYHADNIDIRIASGEGQYNLKPLPYSIQ
jgi:hypothetical protein